MTEATEEQIDAGMDLAYHAWRKYPGVEWAGLRMHVAKTYAAMRPLEPVIREVSQDADPGITQADRDLLAEEYEIKNMNRHAAAIRRGDLDGSVALRAVARSRQRAEAACGNAGNASPAEEQDEAASFSVYGRSMADLFREPVADAVTARLMASDAPKETDPAAIRDAVRYLLARAWHERPYSPKVLQQVDELTRRMR